MQKIQVKLLPIKKDEFALNTEISMDNLSRLESARRSEEGEPKSFFGKLGKQFEKGAKSIFGRG